MKEDAAANQAQNHDKIDGGNYRQYIIADIGALHIAFLTAAVNPEIHKEKGCCDAENGDHEAHHYCN